jgi:LysR family transcriptional regulator for metE and metH
MHLEVKHLKLVQAIQQERSITRAGAKLHLTQSAVSHQLKEIEDRLGTELFTRGRHELSLTPAGDRVLTAAAVVLDELHHAEEDVAKLAGKPRGSVRISTECYTAYHWLPKLVKKFSAKHPHVAVEIKVDATYRAIDALLEGALDLALTNDAVRNDRLRFKKVFDDELVALMPPGHPLAQREYLRPQDFAGESLVLPSSLQDSYFFQNFLSPASVTPEQWCKVPLTEAIVGMVAEGMGISVVARWLVQPYLKSSSLLAVRIGKHGLYREWWAAVRNNGKAPQYLDDFISLVAAKTNTLVGEPAHRA